MLQAPLISTANDLEALIGEKNLLRLGLDTGFTQRSRSITAPRLVPCLLQSMAGGKIEAIADVKRDFNRTYGLQVKYKPFYDRLNRPEFPSLMRSLLSDCVSRLRENMLHATKDGPFAGFDDILIQDGSSFGLRDGLAEKFPGRFNDKSPAAIAVHLLMSVRQDNITHVKISSQADCERHYLPKPENLSGKLILLDRGYDDTNYMRQVDDAGGSFLVRMRSIHDPIVEKIYRSGRRYRVLEGNHLSWVLSKIPKNRAVDLCISVSHKDKVVPSSFRLVASWNSETKAWMRLMTNMTRDIISMRKVLQAYHIRWQIELIFKEFKSYTNMHKFQTNKQFIAEGLLLAALCAAFVRRFIAARCQAMTYTAISTRRVAMCQFLISEVLTAIRCGSSQLVTTLGEIFSFMRSNCQRTNIRREYARGRCALGLSPCHQEA